MNSKKLSLAPYGSNVGSGAKKIIDGQGAVVGYLKGSTIYDNIGVLNGNGVCGYLDGNGNIFTVGGAYFGSIKKHRGLNVFVAVIVFAVLIALLGVSLYYSSFIMGKIGLPTYLPEYPTITLSDDGINSWDQEADIDIFGGTDKGSSPTNSNAFVPGTVGSYNFVIANDSDKYSIEYSLTFVDENLARIPMRYRLKLNGGYIVGNSDNWGTIDDIQSKGIVLLAASSTLFTLEWKWDPYTDDEADTYAALTSASYTLKIKLTAKLTTAY